MALAAVPHISWINSIIDTLLIPVQSAQGLHLDPASLPVPDDNQWPPAQRGAWRSSTMQLFRSCLTLRGDDVRTSILAELSEYYKLSPDECIDRCLHWEEQSVEEWKAGDRSSPAGLREFYNSIQSWSFDLMWYAYLQAAGHAFPAAVLAVNFAAEHTDGHHHLDFGSGVGVTSQLFARRGYVTTSADISRPLLDFARWRLDRHGDRAAFIDLNAECLPSAAYDCITALDTLVHVPEFDVTARELHRALKPGGLLFTNFDVRDQNAETSAWHLYSNAIDLDCRLQASGFVKVKRLGISPTCYKRVEPGTALHRYQMTRNKVAAPIRNGLMFARRIRWPTPTRAIKLVYRLATGRKVVTNTDFASS
jgi:SAM-dependent methyltransferase